ncbi:hypothetical protein EJ08DRAFT_590757 [Tothia fuscella]|uniref:Prolyl 4-hydroxylase alpha subunit domain-containing protein n=1 Tax=Tothia fuscella TaxID=1048955 RepID=A0A9P4NPT0_9PEZI|nr:hypothetical protein EJ08DRAFT_590757 [Tothia fuscella]
MSFKIPQDFLAGPPPNPKKTKIAFEDTGLPEYENKYATVLDGMLTADECRTLVFAAENQALKGWERAMVNIGNGQQAMYEDQRKCGRIIYDSQDVVDRIWERVKGFVPELQKLQAQPEVTGSGPSMRRETWELTRLNERMRFLKYEAGEYFKPHCDGMYETPDQRERTYYTLHLYLNDTDTQTDGEPLEGGATTFWGMNYDCERRFDFAPKTGSILIFQQRSLIHSGDDLIRGTKMTMRTELMYARTEEQGPEWKAPKPKSRVPRTKWLKKRREQAGI